MNRYDTSIGTSRPAVLAESGKHRRSVTIVQLRRQLSVDDQIGARYVRRIGRYNMSNHVNFGKLCPLSAT